MKISKKQLQSIIVNEIKKLNEDYAVDSAGAVTRLEHLSKEIDDIESMFADGGQQSRLCEVIRSNIEMLIDVIKERM